MGVAETRQLLWIPRWSLCLNSFEKWATIWGWTSSIWRCVTFRSITIKTKFLFNSKVINSLIENYLIDLKFISLHLTRNNATLESTPVFIKFPSTPLTRHTAKHCIINIEHIILTKWQFWLVRFSISIKSNTNVKGISRFVLY